MGSWGVTMRQSDYGLDLLGTIVDTQLKAVNFLTFKVADALEVVKADIVKEIMRANRGCCAADLVFYFRGISPASAHMYICAMLAEPSPPLAAMAEAPPTAGLCSKR